MAKPTRRPFRRLTLEVLETRRVLAALPFGAEPKDTGEFMLGRIAVTPVLLESDGSIDPNLENWTPQLVDEVMNKIEVGLQWWVDLLATQSSVHTLEWVIDRTFVDNRLPTPWEPIYRVSNAYNQWVDKFLDDIGYRNTPSMEANIREFNHAQRDKLNTDWAFTIFVVNSTNDTDDSFATGGSFSRAFAFAGGLFQVVPSGRPASTFTHETGHMFWARDEYTGSGNYTQRRGYYDAQNTNAMDLNPDPHFVQEPSIMSSGMALEMAFNNHITSAATLAQIGWRDSDGNGIFDVLDVPLALEGTGQTSDDGLFYRFTGFASAQTLPNRNSSGSQNDITLNRVDRIEYRINGGNWFTIATPGTYTANLNLNIPLTESSGTIEIRAVEGKLGITSNIFEGRIDPRPDFTYLSGINGFVWEDKNQDGTWNTGERGLGGATLTLVDTSGEPLQLQQTVEPDDFPIGQLPTVIHEDNVRIDAVGIDTNGSVYVSTHATASTGTKIFTTATAIGGGRDSFGGNEQQLRARFASPTNYVALDFIAATPNADVRLEAFDIDGNLLKRAERKGLATGTRVTLSVGSTETNIAYILARGFDGSRTRLDNLVYGANNSTRSLSDGRFSFPYLPGGAYEIEVAPPNTSFEPSGGATTFTVSLTSTGLTTDSDFGLYQLPSPWRNESFPEDIDGDGGISPMDVLFLVNEINRNGSRPLTEADLLEDMFLDPDGDRYLGPLDVLQVVNYINTHGVVGGPGGEGGSETLIESTADSPLRGPGVSPGARIDPLVTDDLEVFQPESENQDFELLVDLLSLEEWRKKLEVGG